MWKTLLFKMTYFTWFQIARHLFSLGWFGVTVSDYLTTFIQHTLIKCFVPGSVLVVLGDIEMSETMRADLCHLEGRPIS